MNSTLEVPMSLETERLFLRAPRLQGDGLIVNKAIVESIDELKEWLPFAQKIPTVEETESNLRAAHARFLRKESYRFLIFLKKSNEFVGVASFQTIDWDIPKCEMGYWINTRHGGCGYMTEAINKLVEYGLKSLKFRRIEIRCESTNNKSRFIPERLGFNLEGILQNEDLSADGTTVTDTCIYAITN